MKTHSLLLILAFPLLQAFAGCDFARPNNDADLSFENQDDPIAQLINDLRTSGATVERAGKISQPFFSVEGQLLKIGGEYVQVFAFAKAAEAAAEAARVSPDGTSFKTDETAWMVTWIGPPHFFKKDRLIVLYVGGSVFVVDALERVLGSQFAGIQ